MAPEKSPAFQFYPKEFLMDGNVLSMSLPERGAYITLLCICWQEKSLPCDLRRLANIVGVPLKAFQKLWPSLSACFVTQGDRLFHPRLEKEREKQEGHRQRQSDKGMASAVARANRTLTVVPPNGNHGSTTVQPDTQPELNSPISDLRSPILKPNTNISFEDAVKEKAGRFLEKYPLIYAEERRGAHFQLKPVLHFMTACELVQGWPDEKRLELMFRTFCQLPTSEKMAWPGTPAQFLHLAPEIDVRLRQAGA